MRRCFCPILVAAAAAAGCGGSSRGDDQAPVEPVGGGGRIADYVGDYTGSFTLGLGATVGPSGMSIPIVEPKAEGTVALSIAADGTVSGTRHDVANGKDATLIGTVDDEGRLVLTRPGTNVDGTSRLFGCLAKESGGKAIAVLTEDADGSEVQTWCAYRLSGGSSLAGGLPRTSGVWMEGYVPARRRLRGDSRLLNGETSGTIDLTTDRSGAVRGIWEGHGTVTGVLQNVAAASYGNVFAGLLSVAGKTYEARLVAPSYGATMLGIWSLVGTLTTPDGSGDATVHLDFR